MARNNISYLRFRVYDTWKHNADGAPTKYPTPRAVFLYAKDAEDFVNQSQFPASKLIEQDGRRVIGTTPHGRAILEASK